MKAPRKTWPLKPPPKRLGYPTYGRDGTRVLAVVPARKSERGLVDPWTAWWMDRSQVAGATFTEGGVYCAGLDASHPYTGGGVSYRIPDSDRRRRVAWRNVPRPIQVAIAAAMGRWDGSAAETAPKLSNTYFDAWGGDCPKCGLEAGVGSPLPLGRPMVDGDRAPAKCMTNVGGCGAVFTVLRSDGDLILEP